MECRALDAKKEKGKKKPNWFIMPSAPMTFVIWFGEKEYLAKFLFVSLVLITIVIVWKERTSRILTIQQCSLVVWNKGILTSIENSHQSGT